MNPRFAGFAIAAATLAADQGNKLWLLDVYDIAAKQPVFVGPYLDIVLAKNPGISYSLLSAHSTFGRIALILFALVAIGLISLWIARSTRTLVTLALGLILGGAIGNAIDRVAYGWVADFYFLHAGGFRWYVFNLADVAIVVGVAVLLVDALVTPSADTASHPRR